MTYAPPPTAGAPTPGHPPTSWSPPAPPRRRRPGVGIAVLIVVAVLVVTLVPVALLWAYSRGSITEAAADLPEDLCTAVHTAVGDQRADDALDRVENSLDDRSYATCGATPADPDGVRLVWVDVSRMASTSFAIAASRADEVSRSFCSGSRVGRSEFTSGSGLTALTGAATCVATVVDPASGTVSVAVAGSPAGHSDTSVGIVYTVTGDEADVDAAVRAADDVARSLTARL